MKKVLDVGSGIYPVKDADAIDFANLQNLTYKHDLNKFPYPIKEKAYDIIYCSHTLEHLNDISRVLMEFKRILKDNGRIIIKVPYVSSSIAFQDPTHKHFFTYYSFDYFAKNPEKHMEIWFTEKILTIHKRKLNFVKAGAVFYNYFVEWFANRFPIPYETLFKWIFPAKELEVELTK